MGRVMLDAFAIVVIAIVVTEAAKEVRVWFDPDYGFLLGVSATVVSLAQSQLRRDRATGIAPHLYISFSDSRALLRRNYRSWIGRGVSAVILGVLLCSVWSYIDYMTGFAFPVLPPWLFTELEASIFLDLFCKNLLMATAVLVNAPFITFVVHLTYSNRHGRMVVPFLAALIASWALQLFFWRVSDIPVNWWRLQARGELLDAWVAIAWYVLANGVLFWVLIRTVSPRFIRLYQEP